LEQVQRHNFGSFAPLEGRLASAATTPPAGIPAREAQVQPHVREQADALKNAGNTLFTQADITGAITKHVASSLALLLDHRAAVLDAKAAPPPALAATIGRQHPRHAARFPGWETCAHAQTLFPAAA